MRNILNKECYYVNTMAVFRYHWICVILLPAIVSGVNFSISKEKVLLGSKGRLSMTCDVTEVDIQIIYFIQIQRITPTTLSRTNADADDWQTLALMQVSNNESPKLDPTFTASDKDYVEEESWDSTTPENSYLTLSMNIEKLVCDDARYYRCELSYRSLSSKTIKVEGNATFSAFVKPKVISLIAKKNGFIVQGPSLSDVALVNVGDELELACTANIGSLQGTIVRWQRTSETASTNEFIGYQPPQGTYDDGTAISDNQCGYTREAIIKYNVTAADVNIANKLAFECYVIVSGDPYGNSYTSENNPRFYAEVPDVGSVSSNVRVIIGGVVGGLVALIFIVVIVWFLWFRRQRDWAYYPETQDRHQLIESRDTELIDSASKSQSHNDKSKACRPEEESMKL